MEITRTHKTRHKEYSLAVAIAAVALLFVTGLPASLPGLFFLNIFSIGSILYSAFSVVRHADVLAHRYGEPYGSLILSLAIVILESSLISILMLSGSAGATMMRDTIYAVIIIVMSGFIGFALLLGGKKYRTQAFNFTGIKHFLISIIPLSVIVLVLPTALGTGTYTTGQMAVVSLCCLIVYIYFLRIQTVTHRKFFIYEDEDDDGLHGKPSSHSSAWHFAFLVLHLVAVIAVTKMNSPALELLLQRLEAPQGTIGFLVALLILSPEGAGAVHSILQNQVQRAMNLLLGSVLATISLTVPLVVIIATVTGQDLIMGLSLPDITLMLVTLVVCQTSLTGGKTNAHSGAAHVALFLTYLMLVFTS